MQIAQELAGYSLGEADLLRRAMGKKIRAEMDEQRERFVDGRGRARRRARTRPTSSSTCSQRFADYGFNKSHAAAYALVAYQTAYLKANYPGRVPGGVDDARHGQHRQARRFPRGGRAARHRRRAAVGEPFRAISRSAATASSIRSAAIKGVGKRRWKQSSPRGRAARLPTSPISRARRSARRRQARAGKLAAAGALDAFERDRARVFARGRRRARPGAARARERRDRPERIVRRRRGRAKQIALPQIEPGCRPNGCAANTRRSASSCRAIRSTNTPRCSRKCACRPGRNSRAPSKAARPPAGSPAP